MKNKKVKYPAYLTGNTHIHVAHGNKKVGRSVYCVNLLSGSEPLTLSDGTQLTNLCGTCIDCDEHCKDKCYAIHQQLFRHSNMPTWNDNTLLATLDVDKFFEELEEFIDREFVSVLRYHSMGEIPSFAYLSHMVATALKFPKVQFYCYTKRYEWVEQIVREDGKLPDNLVINVSIWHGNYDNPLKLPEFIYDDGTDSKVAKMPHCPAVDKKGHSTGMTCSKCRRCIFAKPGQKIAVYSH